MTLPSILAIVIVALGLLAVVWFQATVNTAPPEYVQLATYHFQSAAAEAKDLLDQAGITVHLDNNVGLFRFFPGMSAGAVLIYVHRRDAARAAATLRAHATAIGAKLRSW